MKIAYVDASLGAAGDMMLAALADAGAPASGLRRGLAPVVPERARLAFRRVRRCGLTARRASVRVLVEDKPRRLSDVESLLGRMDLPAEVAGRCRAVFRRLFEAEARVHGQPVDQVHLHEAGAVDAVVDVAGSVLALHLLGVGRVVVSPLATGAGTLQASHGRYPVPAPATAELIRGVPVHAGPADFERLTPTGAALLTTLADAWGPLPPMRIRRIGLGAGRREAEEDPNVLRVFVGEPPGAPATVRRPGADQVGVIVFHVDDMTGEAVAQGMDRLFDAGALDVSVADVHMKKGRPGHRVEILADPEALETLALEAFRHFSTLGLRVRREERRVLARRVAHVRTRFGRLPVKEAWLDGRVLRAAPEYEPCARAARKHKVSLSEVQEAALEAWRASFQGRSAGSRR